MNLRTIALACALTATGCEAADSKPAHDPASGYSSAARSENGSTAVDTKTTTNGRETSAALTDAVPSGAAP